MVTDKRQIFFIVIGILLALFLIYLFVIEQRDSFGIYDLKYNRIENVVYIKNSLRPDMEWKKTRFKNLRHAKAYLEKRERNKAMWDIEDTVKSAIEEENRKREEREFWESLLR